MRKSKNLLINLDSLLHGQDFFAHVKEDLNENLQAHLNLVMDYFDDLVKTKNIKEVILRCIKETNTKLSEDEINDIYKYFINAIYLHDIGKINPSFQKEKLNNTLKNLSDDYLEMFTDSNHSTYSSVLYLDSFITTEITKDNYLFYYLLSFSYVISCHHGSLNKLSEFNKESSDLNIYFSKLNNLNNRDFLFDNISNLTWGSRTLGNDNFEIKAFPFYILQKLLFSLITVCDFCATTEFFSGEKVNIDIIIDPKSYKDKYESTEIYKGIMEYKKNPNYVDKIPINKLRSEMFLEATENLKEILKSSDENKNLNKNIFYLGAPTGSGKTNMSINLALNLLDDKINNIFYIFPFNTLVEQTATTLKDIFGKDIVVVNSITPIIEKEDTADNISLINRNILNYPITITSHINFFNALFGTNREQNFPLVKFCNSVIIIDEIQSYKNNIWKEIITLLDYYSRIFNMKIIIMSATLPKLDYLLPKNKDNSPNPEFPELLPNSKKYSTNTIFKDRVKIDISLLDSLEKNTKKFNTERVVRKIELEELATKVLEQKNKKVLVEFISKKNAREFFNLLKEKNTTDFEIEEFSGDDNKLFRKNIIKKIKSINKINSSEKKGFILVATQVIEAGIDIDMDIGFKDISLIDSEEQFLGRINRSCLKENSVAYFFNHFENIKIIYKDDFRVGFGILYEDYKNNFKKLFEEKDYDTIYPVILKEMESEKSKNNAKGFIEFEILFSNLDFSKISEKMKLIDNYNYQIFLNHTIKLEDDSELKGSDVWNDYKNIISNKEIDYAKKKIQLSKLSEKMDLFTYNIFVDDISKKYFPKENKVLGFYYIENGKDAIDPNGKFDKDLLFENFKGSPGMFA